MATTLTAVPKHWYSWDFTIADDNDHVGDVDVSTWREKGTVTVGGVSYRVFREGFASGDFVLQAGASTVARAEKPSMWRREFVIKHDDRHYTLRARSALGRAFVLSKGSSEIGSLSPQRIFSRRATINLPDELPPPVRLFAVWLALLLWKRQAQAAAS